MRIYLDGTRGGHDWRNELIEKLDLNLISYYNPNDEKSWHEGVRRRQIDEKENCDKIIHVFTPDMALYNIASVVDDSNKFSEKTIFHIHYRFWNNAEPRIGELMECLRDMTGLINKNGATCCTSLDEIANLLNENAIKDEKEKL